MKNVCIIGVGNIGSRHLQGLKKVTFPLSIEVIDPSNESLETARERYGQVQYSINHKVSFSQNMNSLSKKIDLAIIATSSNVRRKVIENLLAVSSVKYLILEKILFQERKDYSAVGRLLKNEGGKAWINFSMRTMALYRDLKDKFKKGKIQLTVSGSQYGLITNVIHFVDYLSFLTNCYEFAVETTGLDHQPVKSKRQGFLELNGTLSVYFKDGSIGVFTCYPSSNAPYIIEVMSQNYRCISKESEKKAWVSEPKNEWRWKEVNTNIPYQSEMTNLVVENILKNGTCALTPYDKSMKLHIQLMESLLKFLNKNTKKKYHIYPFT